MCLRDLILLHFVKPHKIQFLDSSDTSIVKQNCEYKIHQLPYHNMVCEQAPMACEMHVITHVSLLCWS